MVVTDFLHNSQVFASSEVEQTTQPESQRERRISSFDETETSGIQIRHCFKKCNPPLRSTE